YDLWAEGGSLSFIFTNKTDSDICLDMERSCFIKNGLAYSYFDGNKDSLNIKGSSSSYTYFSSAQTSTTFISKEMPTKIWIPANSSRFVSGFNISNFVFFDCNNKDLLFPRKISEIIKYNVNNTPLTISNRLVYHFANDEKDRIIENKFWIIDYTNYRDKEIIEFEDYYNCFTETTINFIKVVKYQKNYRFYNKYYHDIN
ncbi:MAG: hypothetical protein J6P97_01790, partial [Bacteroidales bacterium]|nr:hypothetical protein [Bacteroidales bacterium]